jgi:hypothetical protein
MKKTIAFLCVFILLGALSISMIKANSEDGIDWHKTYGAIYKDDYPMDPNGFDGDGFELLKRKGYDPIESSVEVEYGYVNGVGNTEHNREGEIIYVNHKFTDDLATKISADLVGGETVTIIVIIACTNGSTKEVDEQPLDYTPGNPY